jgi:phosphatidylinositol glycan class B
VFYGTNRWDYYVSEGLPLLLTNYLPFALLAMWSSSSISSFALPAPIRNIRFDFTFMIITMISTLSLIAHKEVRFIYPLLPSLHVLAAPHILSFFTAQPLIVTIANTSSTASNRFKSWRIFLLIILVITNLAIGLYTTQVHQRGVIDVLTFLRHEYEDAYMTDQGRLQPDDSGSIISSGHRSSDLNGTFAAFLMPCHSTPWRSHLVHPDLHAWALTCEPPLHIPGNTPERGAYRDEADRFYDDPQGFLKREIKTKERPWPKYVVGFEGIESVLSRYLEEEMPGWKLREKWSGFNTHWHDDWRRKGRVVAWELVDSSETMGGQS